MERPGAIRGLWEWWKLVGKRVGDIQARALLTLFYFVIFAPFALAVRRWSDPLAIKPQAQLGWRPKVERERASMEEATKQF